MGNKIDLSWIDSKKSRWGTDQSPETPWFETVQYLKTGEVLHTQVVKVWQNDSKQDFARWMTKQWMGDDNDRWDGGDMYVRNVLMGAHLVAVLGAEPTLDQVMEFEVLQAVVMSKPDPMAALGF